MRSNPTDTVALLADLNSGVGKWISYQSRDAEGTQTPIETLNRGWGSCRDFAVLLIEAARSLGFGARVVTGYLYNPPTDGAAGAAIGAGSTHAWADIYVPGSGWIAYDPTNGTINGGNLIRVAVTRDISQAVPIAGSFVGTPDDLSRDDGRCRGGGGKPRTPQGRAARRASDNQPGPLGRRRAGPRQYRRRPAARILKWRAADPRGKVPVDRNGGGYHHGAGNVHHREMAQARRLSAVRADRAQERPGHARGHHRLCDRFRRRQSLRDLALGESFLDKAALQDTFGLILTIIILLEFNHSIYVALTQGSGAIQTRIVVLIAILVIARKLMLKDYADDRLSDAAGLRRAVAGLGRALLAHFRRRPTLRARRPACRTGRAGRRRSSVREIN